LELLQRIADGLAEEEDCDFGKNMADASHAVFKLKASLTGRLHLANSNVQGSYSKTEADRNFTEIANSVSGQLLDLLTSAFRDPATFPLHETWLFSDTPALAAVSLSRSAAVSTDHRTGSP
jgi:hypothetical protein